MSHQQLHHQLSIIGSSEGKLKPLGTAIHSLAVGGKLWGVIKLSNLVSKSAMHIPGLISGGNV
jgi:hypothetical protein